MIVLTARDVTVRAGARAIVADVDLDVEAGTVTAIVGPNGAGKSTLLRAVSGEILPARGEVSFLGRALASYDRLELARRRAFVRQSIHLSADVDVLETVLLGRAAHTFAPGAADEALARAALARVGLEGFVDRSMETLSGGEAQRVHLARALVQLEPDGRLMLLDEPIAGLDLAHQHTTLATCVALAARDVAVVTVLHDLGLAARYADQIVVLARGRVVARGAPADVLSRALLRDVFEMEGDVVFRPGLPPLVDLRNVARM